MKLMFSFTKITFKRSYDQQNSSINFGYDMSRTFTFFFLS